MARVRFRLHRSSPSMRSSVRPELVPLRNSFSLDEALRVQRSRPPHGTQLFGARPSTFQRILVIRSLKATYKWNGNSKVSDVRQDLLNFVRETTFRLRVLISSTPVPFFYSQLNIMRKL